MTLVHHLSGAFAGHVAPGTAAGLTPLQAALGWQVRAGKQQVTASSMGQQAPSALYAAAVAFWLSSVWLLQDRASTRQSVHVCRTLQTLQFFNPRQVEQLLVAAASRWWVPPAGRVLAS